MAVKVISFFDDNKKKSSPRGFYSYGSAAFYSDDNFPLMAYFIATRRLTASTRQIYFRSHSADVAISN